MWRHTKSCWRATNTEVRGRAAPVARLFHTGADCAVWPRPVRRAVDVGVRVIGWMTPWSEAATRGECMGGLTWHARRCAKCVGADGVQGRVSRGGFFTLVRCRSGRRSGVRIRAALSRRREKADPSTAGGVREFFALPSPVRVRRVVHDPRDAWAGPPGKEFFAKSVAIRATRWPCVHVHGGRFATEAAQRVMPLCVVIWHAYLPPAARKRWPATTCTQGAIFRELSFGRIDAHM